MLPPAPARGPVETAPGTRQRGEIDYKLMLIIML